MEKKLLYCYYFLGITFFLLACGNIRDDRISAESFFNAPEKTNFRISPNGNFISYLKDYNGLKNIFILDLSSGDTKRITNSPLRDITSAFWASDDELIFMTDRSEDDSLRLTAVNRKSLEIRAILRLPAVQFDWVGPIQVINNEILVILNDRDSSVFDVYRLNILTGQRKLIGVNPGNVVKWLTDYNGELRLAVMSDGLTETILVRDNEEDEFQPVINSIYKSRVEPLGFVSSNRNRIYALSNRQRDKLALVEIDLNTGKEIRLIYQHPDVDLSPMGYSKQKGQMEYIEFNAQYPGRKFFNPELEDVFSKISNKIPHYTFDLIGRDSVFTGFLIRASLDVDPGATFYYDNRNDNLVKLSDENPLLNPERLSPMKPVSFHTRDGVKLSGYLTIPKNTNGKRPAIVIPPSGIGARAVWGYNSETQYLASQGYVVLQVNTRGVIGFGKENWFAGFRKWGTVIQDDIADATKWLIKTGKVDSTKIGIYGFSLGGFSALHGSCFDSHLYACAASYSGITNLFTYLKEIPPYYKPYRQMFHEMVGDPIADSEYFRRHSPVFHADKIKHPVFIAQGGKARRSNVNETNQFVKDLRNKGVSVTYMLRSDEGDQFINEKNKVSFYKELASFFDKNLK